MTCAMHCRLTTPRSLGEKQNHGKPIGETRLHVYDRDAVGDQLEGGGENDLQWRSGRDGQISKST
jgi:hypothetical protein